MGSGNWILPPATARVVLCEVVLTESALPANILSALVSGSFFMRHTAVPTMHFPGGARASQSTAMKSVAARSGAAQVFHGLQMPCAAF